MKCEDEINRLLAEHGAVLVRQRKHRVYQFPDGQIFTLPKSPSDHRTDINNLTKLRRTLGIERDIRKNPNRKLKPGIDHRQETVYVPVDVRPNLRTQLKQLTKLTQETNMDDNNGQSQSLTIRGKDFPMTHETKQRCTKIFQCCTEVQILMAECESGELPKDIRKDIELFMQKITAEVELNFAYARYLQVRLEQAKNHIVKSC